MKVQMPPPLAGLIISLTIFALCLPVIILLSVPGYVFYPENSRYEKFPPGVQRETLNSEISGRQIDMAILQHSDRDRVFIYFHGNGGRIGRIIEQLGESGTVIAPAYPGYARSEGSPSQKGMEDTAETAVNYALAKGFAADQIILIGHSLGGYTAIYAAVKYPEIQELVLINTFHSVNSMCSRTYGRLCFLTHHIFNSSNLASNLKVPVRQYHAKDDEVIPLDEGRKLYQSIVSGNKQFHETTGNHNLIDLQGMF